MATLKKLSSRILVALVVGCALVQMTNGFMVRSFPKWRLAGWNKLPGFKARITQTGLDLFRDVGMKTLQKHIREIHIPDQSGKAGPVSYSARNIKIVSIQLPATISLNDKSKDGLTFHVRKGSTNVHGDLTYKFLTYDVRFKKSYFYVTYWTESYVVFTDSVTKRGTFDAKISEISLHTSIQIGVDSTGRPNVKAKACYFSVGYVKVELHAGRSAKKYEKKVADQLKKTLNQKACSSVIQAINRDLERKLRALKVTMAYKDMFKFDYSLVESPTFNGSVDTAHKGEVYPISNATECPIPIPVIPQDSDRTSKMLFMWITDYLPNSAAYVLQETGQLNHTVTPKNAPPEVAEYLNTSSMVVKMLLPEIGKMYPNMAMWIHLNSTVTPTIKITPKGIEAALTAYCSPYAILPNKTKAFLFTLSVAITSELTVGSKGNNITWVISSFSTELKEVRSEIGNIPISKLQSFVNMAIKSVILPKLNRMGMVGIPLPQMDGFEMMHTNITLGQGYLKIGTDLVHLSSLYSA